MDLNPLANTAITTESLNDSLLMEWQALFAAIEAPRFYQHPDWYRAINEHLLPNAVSFAVARSEHLGLEMILPIQNGVRQTTHSPHHDHLSLNDVVFDRSVDASRAIDLITSAMDSATGWHQWQLHNYAGVQQLDSTIEELRQCRKHWVARQLRETAWFNLDTTTTPVGGKLKRNLRRLRNKFNEKHQLRFESVSDPRAIKAAYEHFLAVEASGWKGEPENGSAIAHDKTLTRFYEALLTPQYAGLTPVINLLFADELCVAAQYGMRTKGCLSLLKIGYTEEYAHYSPGSLILEDCLEKTSNDGIQTLSLVTSPAWARRWHPDTAPVWHITRYNNTSRGYALRVLHSIKNYTKRRLQDAA